MTQPTDDIKLPELAGTLAQLPEHVRDVIIAYGAACARAAVLADRERQQRDAQDAARYRWLRPLLTSIFIPGADDSAECCARFDAHVDAAMAREAERGN